MGPAAPHATRRPAELHSPPPCPSMPGPPHLPDARSVARAAGLGLCGRQRPGRPSEGLERIANELCGPLIRRALPN